MTHFKTRQCYLSAFSKAQRIASLGTNFCNIFFLLKIFYRPTQIADAIWFVPTFGIKTEQGQNLCKIGSHERTKHYSPAGNNSKNFAADLKASGPRVCFLGQVFHSYNLNATASRLCVKGVLLECVDGWYGMGRNGGENCCQERLTSWFLRCCVGCGKVVFEKEDVMGDISADRPTAAGGDREYHLHTREGDIASFCLLVGDPERAEMIAKEFLTDAVKVGDHRGLKSFTGRYADSRYAVEAQPVSVVTTGMGAPSTGIVLPEAVRSGARVFIRVGSCSTLFEAPDPGDAFIVTAACRFDGASRNWAPIEFPAAAHWRVVKALDASAGMNPSTYGRTHLGIEATTDDFNEGQARENIDGYIPPSMLARHEELIHLGVGCYSMEASALFTWCATHRGGIPAGVVNAIYGNRRTNAFAQAGEAEAARIALNACLELAMDEDFRDRYLAEPDHVEAGDLDE